MSKKHIREIANEYGISLKGITIFIDKDPEKANSSFKYFGRADTENIGRIDFMPSAFSSKEELTRTLFHEKMHVEQFRQYGVKYVQENRSFFEDETYRAEDAFIESLKKEGRL